MADEIDTRTVHPWSTVAYVSVTYVDLTTGKPVSVFDPDLGQLVSGSHGTGVVIGRNDVLTAAHVVMAPTWLDQSRYGIKVEVYPGADDSPFSAPLGSYIAASWNSRDISIDSGSITAEQSQFDFALLNFTEPLGDRVGWMQLDPASRFEGTANETGYPGSGPGMMNASVHFTNDWRYYLYHTDELLGPGSSGGPLWYANADGTFVLGVLSSVGHGVSNYAALAAPGVIDWLRPLMAVNDSMIASTFGNEIALTQRWSLVTANTTVWASAKSTPLDDVIYAPSTCLPAVWVDCGAGTDVLRVSGGGTLDLRSIARVDVLDLRETQVPNKVTNLGTDFKTIYLGPCGDAITVTAASATITGGPGNDCIAVGHGDFTINGGGGVDTVVLPLERSHYQLTTGTSTPPAGPSGDRYSFAAVERIEFADTKVALDLNGAAGETARLIGAAFGPQYLSEPAYVGAGLAAFDSGLDSAQVAELALASSRFLQLAGSRSNADVVAQLYRNVIGAPPSEADLKHYAGLLDAGMSQADLLLFAADSDINSERIDLAGLAKSGIEFC